MEKNNTNVPGPKKAGEFIRSKYFLKPFIGVVIGISTGFLYYHFLGCSTGTCAITSHPFSSMLAGGFIGYLISGSL